MTLVIFSFSLLRFQWDIQSLQFWLCLFFTIITTSASTSRSHSVLCSYLKLPAGPKHVENKHRPYPTEGEQKLACSVGGLINDTVEGRTLGSECCGMRYVRVRVPATLPTGSDAGKSLQKVPGLGFLYSKVGVMISPSGSSCVKVSGRVHVTFSAYNICSMNGPSVAFLMCGRNLFSFSYQGFIPLFLTAASQYSSGKALLGHCVCMFQAELTGPQPQGRGCNSWELGRSYVAPLSPQQLGQDGVMDWRFVSHTPSSYAEALSP